MYVRDIFCLLKSLRGNISDTYDAKIEKKK